MRYYCRCPDKTHCQPDLTLQIIPAFEERGGGGGGGVQECSYASQ